MSVITTRERVERICRECAGVWAQSGVTGWERNFLEKIKEHTFLSVKQEKILSHLETKVFGVNDEETDEEWG